MTKKGVSSVFTNIVHVRLSTTIKSGVRKLDIKRLRLCGKRVTRALLNVGSYETGRFGRAVSAIIPIKKKENEEIW